MTDLEFLASTPALAQTVSLEKVTPAPKRLSFDAMARFIFYPIPTLADLHDLMRPATTMVFIDPRDI